MKKIILLGLLGVLVLIFFHFDLEQYLTRSEEHTSELQSHSDLVCRLLLEKKKTKLSIANIMEDSGTENSTTDLRDYCNHKLRREKDWKITT